jgi:hypothetical protein
MMPYAIDQTLIVHPDTHFEKIDIALSRIGLTLERRANASLIDYEPEFASWHCDGHKPIVIYSFNPIVGLRVLDVATLSPALRAKIFDALPILLDTDIEDYLFSPQAKSRLLGLFAIQELQRIDLTHQTFRLQSDPDPQVANTSKTIHLELENIISKRQELKTNLVLLEEAAKDAIAQLNNPIRTAQLKPTRSEVASLFDETLTTPLCQLIDELYLQPPVTDHESDERLTVTAANAGLLRWQNELSQKFSRGYRDMSGWIQPQWIWLTWSWSSPSEEPFNSGSRYDGLVWSGTRWVWIPKAYQLIAKAIAMSEIPAEVH